MKIEAHWQEAQRFQREQRKDGWYGLMFSDKKGTAPEKMRQVGEIGPFATYDELDTAAQEWLDRWIGYDPVGDAIARLRHG